jgi:hypothetical protein
MKLKVKSYVLETIAMVKRERPVKNLTSTLFCVSQRQDGDNLGLPAYNMQRDRCLGYEPLNLCKTNWVNQSELFELKILDDRKTNDSSKILTHLFRNNHRKSDEKKTSV